MLGIRKIANNCWRIVLFFFILSLFPSGVLASQKAVYRYNQQGLEKLEKKDFEGAINDFKTAHFYDPSNKKVLKNLSIAYNNYGFELMNSGQLQRAVEMLEKAVYYDSENPYVFYNLGQAYYMLQDMSKARVVLKEAYRLNPDIKGLEDLLNKVEREVSVEKTFKKYETQHFIIAYSPDIPVEKLSYIRTYLEEAYGRIGVFLDHYPANKVIAVLYSEGDYEKLLGGRPHWALAVFDGKVRIPVGRFKYTNEDIIEIVYHEYAHAVVFDLAEGNCPLWLNEGIASKAEELVQPRKKDLIKKYIEEFGLIPLNRMPANFTSVKDINLATLMYMESYLLVDFILRQAGYTGLRDILKFLGKGVPINSTLARVLGDSSEQFQEKWEKYIVENYGVSNLKYR